MHISRIPSIESKLLTLPEFKFETFQIPFNSNSEVLSGMVCRRVDERNSYYINDEYQKSRIVLHFTAGHLRGDMRTLMDPSSTVSVPYVIGRSGTIYQLFNPKYWAWHLGRGAVGTNTNQSPRTIAIELSNYGFLIKKGEELHTYYSSESNPDVYCHISDKSAYLELETKYRDNSFYAAYTEEQYSSLIILLRYLTSVFNIDRSFLPWEQRFEASQEVLNFDGIVSHVNYRRSGKWDIGPAFDWNRLEEGVSRSHITTDSESFPPVISTLDTSVKLTSNDVIDEKYQVSTLKSEVEFSKYSGDGPEQ